MSEEKRVLNEEELEEVNGGAFFEEAVSELSAGLDVALGGGDAPEGVLYYIKVKGASTMRGPYTTKSQLEKMIERLNLMRRYDYEIVTVRPGESVG